MNSSLDQSPPQASSMFRCQSHQDDAITIEDVVDCRVVLIQKKDSLEGAPSSPLSQKQAAPPSQQQQTPPLPPPRTSLDEHVSSTSSISSSSSLEGCIEHHNKNNNNRHSTTNLNQESLPQSLHYALKQENYNKTNNNNSSPTRSTANLTDLIEKNQSIIDNIIFQATKLNKRSSKYKHRTVYISKKNKSETRSLQSYFNRSTRSHSVGSGSCCNQSYGSGSSRSRKRRRQGKAIPPPSRKILPSSSDKGSHDNDNLKEKRSSQFDEKNPKKVGEEDCNNKSIAKSTQLQVGKLKPIMKTNVYTTTSTANSLHENKEKRDISSQGGEAEEIEQRKGVENEPTEKKNLKSSSEDEEEKKEPSQKEMSKSSDQEQRTYIEIIDDDSVENENITSKETRPKDVATATYTSTSVGRGEEKTLKTNEVVIEINDDEDEEDDGDSARESNSSDDVIVVGVSNPTRSKLDKKLKAISRKRDQRMFNVQKKQDESFQESNKARKRSNSVPIYLNVDDSSDGSPAKKKRSFSVSSSDTTPNYDVAPCTKKTKRSKFAEQHFNYQCDQQRAMEEQERLFRESARRVRQREEEHKKQQTERNQQQQYAYNQDTSWCNNIRHKSGNNTGRIEYRTNVIVTDVSKLPGHHWKAKNVWSRLGLPPNSSYDHVKRNYRKLSLLYHPDKSKHDDAGDRFQAIKEAYETITAKLGF